MIFATRFNMVLLCVLVLPFSIRKDKIQTIRFLPKA